MREDVVNLKQRIECIKSKSEKITQTLKGMPSSNELSDKVSDYAILLSELNIILAKKVRVYLYTYNKIIKLSQNLLSPLELDIVKIKIKKNCSNTAAARLLKTSSSTIYRKYKKALNVFDNISDADV